MADQPTEPKSEGLSLQQARYGKSQPTPFVIDASSAEMGNALPTDGLIVLPEPLWLTTLKAIGIFGMTFLVVFGLLEAPALWSRASYVLTHLGRPSNLSPSLVFLPKLKDRPITLMDVKANPEKYFQQNVQLAGYRLTDLGDNQLLIPKIEVNVPIIWNSSIDEGDILRNLESGVVQYGFTALPVDGRGNVFLFGHSSYPLWSSGDYKTVFANLDRLTPRDQLALTYQGIVYIYEVTDSVVVKPDDLSVLDQTDQPTLSLMTCVPVGTNRDRLVVRSKLISVSSTQPISLPPRDLQDPGAIFDYLLF